MACSNRPDVETRHGQLRFESSYYLLFFSFTHIRLFIHVVTVYGRLNAFYEWWISRNGGYLCSIFVGWLFAGWNE